VDEMQDLMLIRASSICQQALGGFGYLDFYISAPYCIGLEITREGSALSEHLGRFLNPRKYKPMLDCGAIKHHAVIDFRCPSLSHSRKRHDHLYTVQFLGTFREAEIWHQEQIVKVVVNGKASGEATETLTEVKRRVSGGGYE